MNLKTKFEMGQPVWFMYQNKVTEAIVEKVEMTATNMFGEDSEYTVDERYTLRAPERTKIYGIDLYQYKNMAAEYLYKSKQELIETL